MPEPPTNSERLRLPWPGEAVEALSALFEPAAGEERRGACLLAHGAGYHMESPWLGAVAGGLVALGFDVLRFNYPYRERALAEGKRMRPPDAPRVLEQAHRLALDELVRRTGDARPLLAGKSLGARFASRIAAKDAPCRGLVLLGYPLHPPKRPEKIRDEHFPALAQPALFLQGTRDELCDLEQLDRSLEKYGGRATVEVIDGANHGFEVPKRSGRTGEDVLADMLERIDRWERTTFPR